jgi:predicted DNA binding CopG/RHH family protein
LYFNFVIIFERIHPFADGNGRVGIIMLDLDKYETELLQSVENGEWQSRGNIDERMKELQSYVKNQKKKAISIRVSENDIYELKKKALESGVPYQNIIQMLYTSICFK